MRYPSCPNTPHSCLWNPNLIHVPHESSWPRSCVCNSVELLQSLVYWIVVDTTSLAIHHITKHLEDCGAFCNCGYLLHGIFCPRLSNVPKAEKNPGRRPNKCAHGSDCKYYKPTTHCSKWRTFWDIVDTSMCLFQLVRCQLWWMKDTKLHWFWQLCCEGLEGHVQDLVHDSVIWQRMRQVCHSSNRQKPLRYTGDTNTNKLKAWWNQRIYEEHNIARIEI